MSMAICLAFLKQIYKNPVRGKAVPLHYSLLTKQPQFSKSLRNRSSPCSSTEYTKDTKAIQDGSNEAFVCAIEEDNYEWLNLTEEERAQVEAELYIEHELINE